MGSFYFAKRIFALNLMLTSTSNWPRGLMDKASDFESEDCEFESRRGRLFIYSFPRLISASFLFQEKISMITDQLYNRHNVLQVYVSLLVFLPSLFYKTSQWRYHRRQDRYSCVILLAFHYHSKSSNCSAENTKLFKSHSIHVSTSSCSFFFILLLL